MHNTVQIGLNTRSTYVIWNQNRGIEEPLQLGEKAFKVYVDVIGLPVMTNLLACAHTQTNDLYTLLYLCTHKLLCI